MTFAAIVLAGGRAVRMDGADKASVEHGGLSLLEHALNALLDADEVVVVGDPVPTTRPVTFCRESPRFGGPVAALLTGYDALVRRPRTLGVLAVDMPRVTPWTFRRLLAAAEGRDGAFLTDADGRRQLAGVLDATRARRCTPRPRGAARHADAPAARRARPRRGAAGGRRGPRRRHLGRPPRPR